MSEVRVVFLGTGGGRFATITQKRRTAGIRLLNDKFNVHLDPGPGALVHSWSSRLDPRKINAVLVSHSHPDHYTDVEVLIEAMTRGTVSRSGRGVLAASKSVLHGGKTAEVAVSKYHQSLPKTVVEVVAGTHFEVGDMNIVGTGARHSDVDAVGFRFKTDVGTIVYTSDTEFFEGIERYYKGVRVLVLCVLRPSGEPWEGHMTTDDAIKIVSAAKPKLVVLTHFGMKMIFSGPDKEGRRVERETGIETVAAKDGLELWISEEIIVGKTGGEGRGQNRLDTFFRR